MTIINEFLTVYCDTISFHLFVCLFFLWVFFSSFLPFFCILVYLYHVCSNLPSPF